MFDMYGDSWWNVLEFLAVVMGARRQGALAAARHPIFLKKKIVIFFFCPAVFFVLQRRGDTPIIIFQKKRGGNLKKKSERIFKRGKIEKIIVRILYQISQKKWVSANHASPLDRCKAADKVSVLQENLNRPISCACDFSCLGCAYEWHVSFTNQPFTNSCVGFKSDLLRLWWSKKDAGVLRSKWLNRVFCDL